MKKWFCCHDEQIVIGQEYEPWKIPSGGIVTWESLDKYCDHIMPKQRYAIMMGEQIIENSSKFICEVRMLEITPLRKMEICDDVKKEWVTQATFTHIFRYVQPNMTLIGEWNENRDFTIRTPENEWIKNVKYLGMIEDNRIKVSIDGIPI